MQFVEHLWFLPICGVILILIIIGKRFKSRSYKFFNEFALGNKKLTDTVISCSLFCVFMGAGHFFNFIIDVTANGLLYFLCTLLGSIASILIFAYLCVPRMSHFMGSLSLGQAMEHAVGKIGRLFIGYVTVFSLIGIISVECSIAEVFGQYFFQTKYLSISIVLFVCAYVIIGGASAIFEMHFICGVFIWVMLFSIVEIPFKKVGGYFGIMCVLPDEFSIKPVNSHSLMYYISYFFSILIPFFLPTVISRVFSSNNIQQAYHVFKKTAFLIGAFYIVVTTIAFSIFPFGPLESETDVLSLIMNECFVHGFMIFGILFFSVIIISSLDVSINVCAVAFTNDVLYPFQDKMSDAQKIKYTKIFSILCCFTGYCIALYGFETFKFYQIIIFLWTMFIVPPVLFEIFQRKTGERALIINAVVSLFNFLILLEILGNENILVLYFPCFMISLLTFFALSNITNVDMMQE